MMFVGYSNVLVCRRQGADLRAGRVKLWGCMWSCFGSYVGFTNAGAVVNDAIEQTWTLFAFQELGCVWMDTFHYCYGA